MALDHYAAQVHLRNFYAANLGGKMLHVFHKRTMEPFPCGSKDVCRLEDHQLHQVSLGGAHCREFPPYL